MNIIKSFNEKKLVSIDIIANSIEINTPCRITIATNYYDTNISTSIVKQGVTNVLFKIINSKNKDKYFLLGDVKQVSTYRKSYVNYFSKNKANESIEDKETRIIELILSYPLSRSEIEELIAKHKASANLEHYVFSDKYMKN